MDMELMTKKEIKWVNDYNQFCFSKLKDSLQDDEKTSKWLEENTKPLK
jgi:hypothetical protein